MPNAAPRPKKKVLPADRAAVTTPRQLPPEPLGDCLLPDRGQTLLLRAGLSTGAEVLDAWSEWVRGTPLSQATANDAELFPRIAANLREFGLHPPEEDRLESLRRETWIRNQRILHQLGQVITELEHHQIPVLVLKGCALAPSVYGDPSERPMTDSDILVPLKHIENALSVLAKIGYEWETGYLPGPNPVHHAVTLSRGQEPSVDLHWHILKFSLIPGFLDDLWDHAGTASGPTKSFPVLGDADLLLHAVIHGIACTRTPSSKWALDAALLVRRRGATLDWARFVSKAKQARQTRLCAMGLEYLVDHLGSEVPQATLDQLQEAPCSRVESLEVSMLRSLRTVSGWPLPRLWRFPLRLPKRMIWYAGMQAARGESSGLIGFWMYACRLWNVTHPALLPLEFVRRILGGLWS